MWRIPEMECAIVFCSVLRAELLGACYDTAPYHIVGFIHHHRLTRRDGFTGLVELHMQVSCFVRKAGGHSTFILVPDLDYEVTRVSQIGILLEIYVPCNETRCSEFVFGAELYGIRRW